MVTPEIIMGISLLIFFFQLFGAIGSIGQISIAHITFCISYVAVTVRARASGMDPRLEEAARDLGASAWGAFRYVTLPLILPAVLAGAMLAFALSFDDLVVTSFNCGRRLDHAADLHLQLDQVRGHARDQRDLDDHRRGRLDRAVHRLAARRVPRRGPGARHRGAGRARAAAKRG